MELKYIDELNSLIEKFVKPFGCKVEIDTDFAYYPEEKVITWSPFVMDKADRFFQGYVRKNYSDIEADIFLWSLLHEVGHHLTYEFWSNAEIERFGKIKDWIEDYFKENKITDIQERLLYEMYFSVNDEARATGWAAEYMETYSERVEKFWRDFVDAYEVFLSLNKIEKNFSEKI